MAGCESERGLRRWLSLGSLLYEFVAWVPKWILLIPLFVAFRMRLAAARYRPPHRVMFANSRPRLNFDSGS